MPAEKADEKNLLETEDLDDVIDPFNSEQTIEKKLKFDKKNIITKNKKHSVKEYVKASFLVLLEVFVIWFVLVLGLVIEKGGIGECIKDVLEHGYMSNIMEIGYIALLLSFTVFFYYLRENEDYILKTKNIILIYSIPVISCVACILFGRIHLFLRPCAFCAMLVVILVNRKDALILNSLFCVMMIAIDCVSGIELFSITMEEVVLFIVSMITGMVAVFVLDKEGIRLKILLKGLLVSLPMVVCAVINSFTTDENIFLNIFYATASGFLSSVLTLVVLPFYERIFVVVTNFRLMEIVDHKAKLMVELKKKAPGTYNHSMVVSTLAEACADVIGENALLVRACAYYHDIGKIRNSEYFGENQKGANPHDEITPELSANIIREHTTNGAEIIRKFHLPEVLADCAQQHHGTLFMRYFYKKAELYTDAKPNMENYCYRGPKPQTKIASIIMICDACEAAVRSLSDRTYDSVEAKVKEIIEERMNNGQFSDCNITLKELDAIRLTIANTLGGVYHDRVKYPIMKKEEKIDK